MILILVKWDCCKLSEGGSSRRARGAQGQKQHDASLKQDSECGEWTPPPELFNPDTTETRYRAGGSESDGGWGLEKHHTTPIRFLHLSSGVGAEHQLWLPWGTGGGEAKKMTPCSFPTHPPTGPGKLAPGSSSCNPSGGCSGGEQAEVVPFSTWIRARSELTSPSFNQVISKYYIVMCCLENECRALSKKDMCHRQEWNIYVLK